MNNPTFIILDKGHWEVLQLDLAKVYLKFPKLNVWQIGEGMMRDYPIEKEMQDKFWKHVLWGK